MKCKLFLIGLSILFWSTLSFGQAGEIDLSFNYNDIGHCSGIGADGIIHQVLRLDDGRMIIAGAFSNYNYSGQKIIRINPDGQRDISFAYGVPNDDVKALAIQSDGKILIGGSFDRVNSINIWKIARLDTNGRVDSSFNPTIEPNGDVLAIAVQSDGKIIVGGYFDCYNGTSFKNNLVRLNPDGSIDYSFETGTGTDDAVKSIVIQNDGKILVGGKFDSYNDTTIKRVVRLYPNGSIDQSFEIGPYYINGTGVNDMIIQPDNKIIIGGKFSIHVNGVSVRDLARLNTNGNYDTQFNIGVGVIGYGVNGLFLKSNGQLVICGNFNKIITHEGNIRNNVAILNSDGSLDTTFNPGIGPNDEVFDILENNSGNFVMVGSFTYYRDHYVSRIAQITSDGDLDLSFNPLVGPNGGINESILQPDGKIIISGGFTAYGGIKRYKLARIYSDGTLDYSFDPGDLLIGQYDYVAAIAVQDDGKILVGGEFNNTLAQKHNLARLNQDGSIDSTFNTGSGPSSDVFSIKLASDGGIFIGGEFSGYNSTARGKIAKLLANGTLDETFAPTNGANAQVYEIVVQDDGKIIIGGRFIECNNTTRMGLARINPDGTLDESFNPPIYGNASVYALAIQPDNKLLVGGSIHNYNSLVRFNTDGSVDNSFMGGSGPSNSVYDIVLQEDGKILIGGHFSYYNNSSSSCLARINQNGSFDASFDVGEGFNTDVKDVLIQPNKRIVASGYFSDYNEIGRSFITRIHNDNTITIKSIDNETLRIYPNPFKDEFTVDGPKPDDKIKIFDILGKEQVFEISSDLPYTINLRNNNAGLYFISIEREKEVSFFKVVKQ